MITPGIRLTVRRPDQLIVGIEEAAMDEVVAFDAGKGEGIGVLRKAAHALGVRQKRHGLALPRAPGARGLELDIGVGIGEPPIIGGDQIVALWQRDWAQIILERFREDPAAALLIEPFE